MRIETVDRLVELFDLSPHPEGGFFKETYRAKQTIAASALKGVFDGDRAFSTAILFLVPAGAKSTLHRIKSDEVWHFYMGDPFELVEIDKKGDVQTVTLGLDLEAGQRIQHVVPAGHWFGGMPKSPGKYSFMGCTVAPGFDFADFEMAKKSELLAKYPAARNWIELLSS